MKQKKSIWELAFATVCFLLLALTACKKTTAPASSAINQTGTLQTSPVLSAEEITQQRLAWNLKTLVEPYEHAGYTNPKWDEAAKLALTEFARSRAKVMDTNESWSEIISTNAAAAIRSGCNDPMINYLFIKFAMDQTNSKEAFVEAFGAMAEAMNSSSYPPIRKFYAADRAMEQIYYTYPTNHSQLSVTAKIGPMVTDNLNATLADKTMPAREAYEVADTVLSLADNRTNLYVELYHCIEKPLIENWPDDYTTLLLKGSAEIKLAYIARGFGYADKVTPEGWKLFGEHLAEAESALEKARQLNSNDEQIPIQMIRVTEGLQKTRDQMEIWFNRAMIIDPNCYQACSYKLHYLYPQWYGSRDDMVGFGRECVASTNWGGNVPLILADAHREYWLYLEDSEVKSNYWKSPDVWPDVQAAFEKFFSLNPNATGYYYNYAWFAYKCEQWDKLNELIPKLGSVNYDYFGGKDEFDKMIRLAKENAGKPK